MDGRRATTGSGTAASRLANACTRTLGAAWVTLACCGATSCDGLAIDAALLASSATTRELEDGSRPLPAARIVGRVVDEKGEAIVGASVVAGGVACACTSATTIEGGFWSIDVEVRHVGHGGGVELRLTRHGFAAHVASIVLPAPGEVTHAGTIVLTSGTTLSGSVRGHDGAPAANASVTATWDGVDGKRGRDETRSDARGEFVVHVPRGVKCTISARDCDATARVETTADVTALEVVLEPLRLSAHDPARSIVVVVRARGDRATKGPGVLVRVSGEARGRWGHASEAILCAPTFRARVELPERADFDALRARRADIQWKAQDDFDWRFAKFPAEGNEVVIDVE